MALPYPDYHTACEFEFDLTGSGDLTVVHNMGIPVRWGRRQCTLNILLGNAYVKTINENNFVINVTGSGARVGMKASVSLGDF